MNKNTAQLAFNKKEAMLKALQATYGSVRSAASMAQITPQTHYNWYKYDEDYRDRVDVIKYEAYEEYKDLVIEAVFKKVKEGNAAVINKSFHTLFAKWAEQMERANPYRPRLVPKIKYVDKPGDAKL